LIEGEEEEESYYLQLGITLIESKLYINGIKVKRKILK